MEGYVKKYADVILSPSEFLLGPTKNTSSIIERQFVRERLPDLLSPREHHVHSEG